MTLSSASTTAEASAALVKQVSIPNFRDWHDQSSSFHAMAYYTSRETAVTIGSTAEYAQVTRVSPEFFPVFGVQPSIGRFFTTEEWKQGGGGALMISYAYWQSHFGGSPTVLGRTIRVFGGAIPIAGVMPAGFGFPNKTDLWYPANTTLREPTAEFRGAQNYLTVGRLKDGVAIERAQTEMKAIAGRLERQYPKSNKGWASAGRLPPAEDSKRPGVCAVGPGQPEAVAHRACRLSEDLLAHASRSRRAQERRWRLCWGATASRLRGRTGSRLFKIV